MEDVSRSKEVVGGGCSGIMAVAVAVVVVEGDGEGVRVRGWMESESSGYSPGGNVARGWRNEKYRV